MLGLEIQETHDIYGSHLQGERGHEPVTNKQ